MKNNLEESKPLSKKSKADRPFVRSGDKTSASKLRNAMIALSAAGFDCCAYSPERAFNIVGMLRRARRIPRT